MPIALTVWLLALVVTLFLLRQVLPVLPLSTWARRIGALDAVLSVLGILGLVGHCVAMFFPRIIQSIPGTTSYARVVNELGRGSAVLFVIPALLLLVGLHRQQPVAIGLLLAALAAVGITMYDHGSLRLHLTMISIAVVLISLIGTLLVLPPRPVSRQHSE